MENLSIKAVSKIVGITPFTLRAWEKRYRILKPKRSENGRRVYSLSDVEKLRLIVALRNAGHALPQVASLNIRQLTQLLDNTSMTQDGTKITSVRVSSPENQLENIFVSIEKTDMDQLASQLKMLQLQLDTKSFLLEVVVPLLQRLGNEVAENRLDIFHEHAVSALLRHLLSGILYSTERSTSFREKNPILFSTPEFDHHEFGAMIAAILAMLNGYRVFYLGANMPAESMAKAALALKSPLAVIACSAPEESLDRETLKRYFLSVLKLLPESTSLWIGGFRSPELRQLSKEFRRHDSLLGSLEEFDRKLRLNMSSVE